MTLENEKKKPKIIHRHSISNCTKK